MADVLITGATLVPLRFSSTAFSEAAGPTTVTFVQQVAPITSVFSATTTAAAAASSSIQYGVGGQTNNVVGKDCEISSLWNWNTINTCFIDSRWHITSAGAFAGTCIFALLLVLLFFFLRRAREEYDHQFLREHCRAYDSNYQPPTYEQHIAECDSPIKHGSVRAGVLVNGSGGLPLRVKLTVVRPGSLQQGVRATLALMQFVVGYFVLLLVMSWNGWIFLCVALGVWIGGFVFDWKTFGV